MKAGIPADLQELYEKPWRPGRVFAFLVSKGVQIERGEPLEDALTRYLIERVATAETRSAKHQVQTQRLVALLKKAIDWLARLLQPACLAGDEQARLSKDAFMLEAESRDAGARGPR